MTKRVTLQFVSSPITELLLIRMTLYKHRLRFKIKKLLLKQDGQIPINQEKKISSLANSKSALDECQYAVPVIEGGVSRGGYVALGA